MGEGKAGEREIEGAERATATYFIASKVNGRFIKGTVARVRVAVMESPRWEAVDVYIALDY